MCEHGDTVERMVPIGPLDAHDGKPRWDYKPVDRCLAPIIDALNGCGVLTRSSCCGHGEGHGSIVLHDGRELAIKKTIIASRP